jgi:hypothetical protein
MESIECRCGEIFGPESSIRDHKCEHVKDLFERIISIDVDIMMTKSGMEYLPSPIALVVEFGNDVNIIIKPIDDTNRKLIIECFGKVSKKCIYIITENFLGDILVFKWKSKRKKVCSNCQRECNTKCKACNIEHYCSRECQRADWNYHKRYCKKLKDTLSYYTILSDIWKANKQNILSKTQDISSNIMIVSEDLNLDNVEITTNLKKIRKIVGAMAYKSILYVKKHDIYIEIRNESGIFI